MLDHGRRRRSIAARAGSRAGSLNGETGRGRRSLLAADPNALFLRLGLAAGKCTVDLASAPYVASVIAMLKAKDGEKPRRYVDGHAFAAWLEMVNGVMTDLLVPLSAAADFDEERTVHSLLFLLEVITRGEPDAATTCEQIASGKLTLEAALRARELARLTDKLAVAEKQLADAPAVQLDPKVLAVLDEASFLRGDDIAIPVHPRATVEAGAASSDDGNVQVTFTIPAALAELRALYRTWAHRDGWLIEHEEGDDRHHELRLARRGHRVWLLITPWIETGPSSMIMMRVAAKSAIRFEPGVAQVTSALSREARVAAGPPSPPPVTRPWPAVLPSLRATPDSPDALSVIVGCSPAPPQPDDWSPEHVVADRGLLYIADKYFIWCVDSVTGRMERIAGERNKGPFDWITGLAFDGDDTLFVSDRMFKQVSALSLSTGQITTLASGFDKPTFVAHAGATVFVACRDSEVHAIDRATGAAALFATGFANIRALLVHRGELYVLDDDGTARVNSATGGVTRVLTVTRNRLTGLATDGESLYATSYEAIERITDRLTDAGTRDVLAGAGKNPRHDPDGLAEDAHVADSIAPTWDGGGLVFLSRHRVRRFDFANRYISTLPVPPASTEAIEGSVVGIGSLGGSRLAIGVRKFRDSAAVIVIDFATGARDDIPLEVSARKLRTLTTDGSDRVFFTDETDAVWVLDVRTRTEAPLAAISHTEHATALAFDAGGAAGRLFATLAESGTAISLDLATNARATLATGLTRPRSLVVDPARNALYIGDAQILHVDLTSLHSTPLTDAKLSGTLDGPRGTARFVGWENLTLGPDGNLYFTNLSSVRQLRVSDGHVSTVIGGFEPRLVLGALPGGLCSPTVLCTLPTGELAIFDREQSLVLRARL